jgi:hypothetical protein
MSGNVINHEAEQPEYVGGQHSYASDAEWMQSHASDRGARQAQHVRDTLAIAQERADRLEQWIASVITSKDRLTPEQRLEGLRLVEEMSPSQRVRIDVEKICAYEKISALNTRDANYRTVSDADRDPEQEPENGDRTVSEEQEKVTLEVDRETLETLSKAVRTAMDQTAPGFYGWDELRKAEELLAYHVEMQHQPQLDRDLGCEIEPEIEPEVDYER